MPPFVLFSLIALLLAPAAAAAVAESQKPRSLTALAQHEKLICLLSLFFLSFSNLTHKSVANVIEQYIYTHKHTYSISQA